MIDDPLTETGKLTAEFGARVSTTGKLLASLDDLDAERCKLVPGAERADFGRA